MARGEPTGASVRRLGAPGIIVDGRYRLEHMLGAGGFGEVWAAVQEVEGSHVRPVALKLLNAPSTIGATPMAGKRAAADSLASSSSAGGHSWLDEVRAVRDVRCEAIATIFDVGISREPRLAFIAMELLEGSTLDHRLVQGPVYWRRALAIARDVASALVACHAVEVSHCDLKPQNVFLTEDGRVCVLDFGVAALGPDGGGPRSGARAASDPAPDGLDMGATGAVAIDEMPEAVVPGAAEFHIFGTPGFIPPESFRGDPMGPAADVFALGVVLYRMISGRLPHRLDQATLAQPTTAEGAQRYQAALNTATIGANFVPLGDAVAGVPEGVHALVVRLLDPDPDRRPVADLVAAIDEVIHRPYGIPDPPYVGLAAFDARRAGYIAGRDGDIDEVTDKLRDSRAVVLAGPSGCGKSSLAIAGVAHRIDETLLLGRDGWRLVTLRPSQGAEALRVIAGAIPLPTNDGTGTVVVVDQLEEVVRLEEAARIAFCTALATLVEGTAPVEVCGRVHAPGAPVRVIATCRDDLFGRVASLPELRRFPERNLFTVRGVEPNAMAQIVEGPARAAGYRLEGGDEVVAEAVRIVASDPGALPLVQFALTRWWEGRDSDRKVLLRAVWDDIGGIEGALAEAAQALYDGFNDAEREQMRALLIAMFRPDGTRVRVEERVVVTTADGRAVLARLVERRLVTRYSPAEGAASLEVVHEALGRRWPMLHQWLEETRSERELIADVHYDAERWRAGGKPADLLWRGERLEAAQRLYDRLGEHAAFIDASREAAGKQAWRRRGSRGLLAIASIVAAIMVLTYVGSNRERRRARDAQAAAEVERAKAESARGEAETALARNIELKNQAEAAQRRAEEEKAKAVVARAEAQDEAAKNAELSAAAEAAKGDAERAMRQAQNEKAEADRQRELNRLAAETAEKQRREAEAQKKYAETAQRLHEMARKRMERIEAQYEQLRREHKALQQQVGERP
ncbi:MAG TPA: protein kinase [Kofleriaceae bacterium]|nr:protein kinase [Kofleriaceae bacterium]